MPDRAAAIPYLHLIQCPVCASSLEARTGRLTCSDCGRSFPIEKGLPHLYVPLEEKAEQGVGKRVREFYEEYPFPDYGQFDNVAALIDKARQGVFARLLDEQIPFSTRVLECGCGTGQLSNFLGVAHRTVFGTDVSLTSLELADDFRRRNSLERVFFLQMNLFKPSFREGTFDFVICNGVLHHTADPVRGFSTLARLLKPGGHLIVGLYHRYGRFWTDARRALFRLTGPRLGFLDARLRRLGKSEDPQWKAWFYDQYRNPHEVKYTIGTVLNWLPRNRLELVKTIPKTLLTESFQENERLFEPEPAGNALSRSAVELGQLFRGSAEGGFFTVIARKMP